MFRSDEPSPSNETPLVIRDDMLDNGPSNGRLDFEQNMSCLPRFTILLILMNALVFLWEMSSGALDNEQSLVAAGALSRAQVAQGELWRMASAMFLHGSPDHLMGNCVIFFIVGMACEHAFGITRTAVAYFVAGLCGSALSMLLHPGPSVGASGAIFGIVGCVVVFFHRHHRAVMLRDKRIGFVLLIWALYQIFLGQFNPFIDNGAHIGGFLAGAVAGLLLHPKLLPKQEPAVPTVFRV